MNMIGSDVVVDE